MARTCTICTHSERTEIDQALLAGEAFRHIAARFGTSASALLRHKKADIPATLARAKQADEEVRAETLFERLQSLSAETNAILGEARGSGNHAVALQAIGKSEKLLELEVVPVVNENDVVAVDEIGEVFGDNDRLSALVANLVDADLLLVLTDIEGLYSADPRTDPNATLISQVDRVDAQIESLAGEEQHTWARGGMATKLEAAKLVTTSGIPMIMCHGRAEDAVLRTARGETIGTYFKPANSKLEARKRWMLSGISQRGQIAVDAGASGALVDDHRSLLPAGIKSVEGDFNRGESVYVVDSNGKKIACGIANYAARDIAKTQGLRSNRIEETLGYHYGQEVVHRNN